jgi:hypothetical protein
VRIGYCLAKYIFFERKYANFTEALTFPWLGEKNNGRSEGCFLEKMREKRIQRRVK